MPGPGAAINLASLGTHYFLVSIPSDGTGGVLSLFFRKVSGLSRSFEVEKVVEGGRNFATRNLWKGPASHGEVTLENGLVGSSVLWDWSRKVDSGTGYRKDITITHMAPYGVGALQIYTLVSAWPVSWQASDLDASSGQLAVITLKLAFDDLLVGPLATSPAEPTKAVLAAVEGSKARFTFPINPSQLTISRNLNWTGKETTNTAYPPLAAPSAALDKLTINNLLLDGGDTKVSVGSQLTALHALTLPQQISGVKLPRPPLVSFTWKDTRFVGGLSSVTFTVSLFSAAGDPLRASVNLTLDGQLIPASGTQEIYVGTDSETAGKGR